MGHIVCMHTLHSKITYPYFATTLLYLWWSLDHTKALFFFRAHWVHMEQLRCSPPNFYHLEGCLAGLYLTALTWCFVCTKMISFFFFYFFFLTESLGCFVGLPFDVSLDERSRFTRHLTSTKIISRNALNDYIIVREFHGQHPWEA